MNFYKSDKSRYQEENWYYFQASAVDSEVIKVFYILYFLKFYNNFF